MERGGALTGRRERALRRLLDDSRQEPQEPGIREAATDFNQTPQLLSLLVILP